MKQTWDWGTSAYLLTWMLKSPLTVPAWASAGFVFPTIVRDVWTTLCPSHTYADINWRVKNQRGMWWELQVTTRRKGKPSPWRLQVLRSCNAADRDRKASSSDGSSAQTRGLQAPSHQIRPKLTREQAHHRNAAKHTAHLQHLQADQLETSLLEALDYLPHEATLNSVWLYCHQSPLPRLRETCGDKWTIITQQKETITNNAMKQHFIYFELNIFRKRYVIMILSEMITVGLHLKWYLAKINKTSQPASFSYVFQETG